MSWNVEISKLALLLSHLICLPLLPDSTWPGWTQLGIVVVGAQIICNMNNLSLDHS